MVHYENSVETGSFCRLGLGNNGVENVRFRGIGVGEVWDLVAETGHGWFLWVASIVVGRSFNQPLENQ